jgi:hypothetical protein
LLADGPAIVSAVELLIAEVRNVQSVRFVEDDTR